MNSDKITTAIVGILIAIISVAVITVLVSKNVQTGSVITAAGNGFSTAVGCAISPVTGGQCAGNGMIENVTSSFSPL